MYGAATVVTAVAPARRKKCTERAGAGVACPRLCVATVECSLGDLPGLVCVSVVVERVGVMPWEVVVVRFAWREMRVLLVHSIHSCRD